MNIYKITNISQTLGKREFKFNSVLNIDYVDGLTKKTILIKPNETIFLRINSLPLSVQRLRMSNLITVAEVSEPELAKVMNDSKPKNNLEVKPESDEDKRSKKSKKK
jgi:hypothetical protein